MSVVVEEGDATKNVSKILGPIFFFTPLTAKKYQVYLVFKMNKFGVKQARQMGIDGERISIQNSKTNNSGKQPTWYVYVWRLSAFQ